MHNQKGQQGPIPLECLECRDDYGCSDLPYSRLLIYWSLILFPTHLCLMGVDLSPQVVSKPCDMNQPSTLSS